ncbi:MAG: sulfite exporter TauE/SafE family protein [Candidatus Thorarchaeota archaeon]|nr:MAG: sulfite exporter TauE/SafE family protein [Candidatus Thorarchaeota archaeon]
MSNKEQNKTMQAIVFEFGLLVLFSFIIGLGSSMVGISGGVFRTPLLILVFGLTAQFSTAVSLFAALFLAIPSSIEYNRNEKKPIMFKLGLLITLLAIPGLLIGVFLKSMIVDDYILRIIFGVSLTPIAIMMLLTKGKPNRADNECNDTEYDIARNSIRRMIIAGFACFVAGIAGAMLGLGGGVIIVPALCIVLGMPMLIAAATSVFSIIFISIAGTIMNLAIIPQIDNISLFIFYSVALAIGMIFGGKIGASFACKVDGVLLKRIFGVILVFPLVHLMYLGQLWLDPLGTNPLLGIVADIIIWILIVIPCAFVWIYWRSNNRALEQKRIVDIAESKGS